MYVYIITSDFQECIEGYAFITYSSALEKVSRLAQEEDKDVWEYTILKLKLKL